MKWWASKHHGYAFFGRRMVTDMNGRESFIDVTRANFCRIDVPDEYCTPVRARAPSRQYAGCSFYMQSLSSTFVKLCLTGEQFHAKIPPSTARPTLAV